MSVAVSAHSAMGSGSFASGVSSPPTTSSPNVGAGDTFLLWMVECDIASPGTGVCDLEQRLDDANRHHADQFRRAQHR